MKLLGYKVKHPFTAFFIYLVIGAVLSKYGIVDGTALIFCMFMGIAIYRAIARAEGF